MKKVCLFILCAILLVTVVGCGTIKGIGEDFTALGGWVSRGSCAATEVAE